MATDAHLVRISNGEYELAVDPSIGRIMRYGRVDGANVLWTNPRAQDCASPFVGWTNWGGDKVWIWPERDWIQWHGAHAPPGDPPPESHHINRISSLSLRVTSPIIESYGVRIVREITLNANGAGVRIVNKLEKVSHTALQMRIGLWTVTQLHAAEQIFARLVSDAHTPKFASFENGAWPSIREEQSVAVLQRPREAWAKIGLEADALAANVGEQFFSIQSGSENAAQLYEPHCRAQVFSDPDRSQFRVEGLEPYIEFEFTSPTRTLQPGDSMELVQHWNLSPQSPSSMIALMSL